ncbi:MAG: peroxiredoxin [Rubricoccaceae bacterium]|nr:peroxiredoxin [Rubricoccaceae bacterium]
MNPSVGELAPIFTLFSDEKKPWVLTDQRGKHVVLIFFPAAFSGTCTTELNTINNNLARLQDLNAVVVGISTDTPYCLAEFRAAQMLNFHLLSDHDAKVCAMYGAKHNRDFAMGLDRIAKRAVFVLNTDGIIVHKEVLDNPGNEPDYEALAIALEKLQ